MRSPAPPSEGKGALDVDACEGGVVLVQRTATPTGRDRGTAFTHDVSLPTHIFQHTVSQAPASLTVGATRRPRRAVLNTELLICAETCGGGG